MEYAAMPEWVFQKEFQATDLGTRQTLGDLCAGLISIGTCADMRSRVEMVLAEVLNNIAEHAYQERGEGLVSIRLETDGARIKADITDFGQPMPNETLPCGQLPASDVALCDLPEGGFGWHLIHTQSDALSYERHGGQNRTSITFEHRRTKA